MLIYKKTFAQTDTLSYTNFPIEDQYYANNNEGVIVDGVTRDPIGVLNYSMYTAKEMLDKYPKPSGSEYLAKELVKTFISTQGTLKEKLVSCNQRSKEINDELISNCDYLQNDYFGAVASCLKLKNNILNYAYICDCGVIVYDKNGKIKFQTTDDKLTISDPYIEKLGSWDLPEVRKETHKNYRNNPNMIIDNHCVSYGSLTGQKEATYFIKSGFVTLEKDDLAILYSDGFYNYLHEKEFIDELINFDEKHFEEYINKKSLADLNNFGREKTIIIFKNN